MTQSITNRDGQQEEAMQVSDELAVIIAIWCHGLVIDEIDPFTGDRQSGVNVPTSEGIKRASRGDWVIKKEDKTFDVKKPNEFLHHSMET